MIRRGRTSLIDLIIKRVASADYSGGYLLAIRDAKRYEEVTPNLADIDISQRIQDFNVNMREKHSVEWNQGYIDGWEDYRNPEGQITRLVDKVNTIKDLVSAEDSSYNISQLLFGTKTQSYEDAEEVEKILKSFGFQAQIIEGPKNPEDEDEPETFWVTVSLEATHVV